MLIFNREVNVKWIVIGGAILIGLMIFVILSIPKSKPPNPIPVISDTQAQLQKQYDAQLKAKDITINDYKSRLVVSQEKYLTKSREYDKLQKEKENVKPPITNAETRDRFIALGFNPLPIK